MADFVKIIAVSDLGPGKMKTVQARGKRLALANVDGQFFAIDDACTHAQCSLGGEGFLEGGTVTCGCHGSKFDVTNGKVLAGPASTDEGSYAIKVENGDVYVRI